MKDSHKEFKRLSSIGIGLCAACCLLPIVGVTFSIGVITAMTAFLEWVSISASVLVLLFFAVYYFRSKKAATCDIDCSCKR